MRVSILILSLFLLSCSATRKANKFLSKAFHADSATVALRTRTVYPCIITASDTISVVSDSLIYIDCPDTNQADYFTKIDTITKEGAVVIKTIKVPIHLPIKTVYINTKIEDSAKIKVIMTENSRIIKEYTKVEKKVDNRNTLIKILSGLLLAAGLFLFILIKRK